MAKSILLSVQPKWVEKILNGEKTIEIRKVMPKCELPIDVYIYMTKFDSNFDSNWELYLTLTPMQKYFKNCIETCFGKVVAKFTLNRVNKHEILKSGAVVDYYYKDLQRSSLSIEQISKYAGNSNYVYSWHIDNLVIFEEPRELKDFKKLCSDYKNYNGCNDECGYSENGQCLNGLIPITKAPQSYCYVEVEE